MPAPCFGDRVWCLEFWGNKGRDRGILGHGPLYREGEEKSFGAVTDGLSNTLFASESCVTSGEGNRQYKSVVAERISGIVDRASDCAATRSAGGELRTDVGVLAGGGRECGWSWTRNSMFSTAFMCALPPNSPSCCESDWDGHGLFLSASSHHPGGVSFARLDGSAGFASDSISAGDSTRNLGATFGYSGRSNEYNGPSDMGVWGAMATIDQGESVSF